MAVEILEEICVMQKKILEEEGWFVENNKLMKDGKEFRFEILILSPSDEKIALAFQKNLEILGITYGCTKLLIHHNTKHDY